MGYNTEELKTKAIKLIEDNNLIFVEDVCALLGIVKSTYYLHFPEDSNDSNHLRDLLQENKVSLKIKIRKKWLDSDRDTGLMALYKLCSTPEEHKLLQQNYTDHTTDGEKINHSIEVTSIIESDKIKSLLDKFDNEGDEGIH